MMDELYLTRPSLAYAAQIAACRQEFLDRGERIDGSSRLEDYLDPRSWLAWLDALSVSETCPDGFVVGTQWLCVRASDDRVVGMVNLRHTLNDYLLNIGGHIGYSTRPDERTKGYAKAMLGMALKEAAKLGLNNVLITCYRSNEASRRTILAWGGVMENEFWYEDEGDFVQRYWVEVRPDEG